jgi:hypothetical protein
MHLTYGIGLVDVAAGREKEVGDALGSAEGGPVKGDVHLHVCDERVGPLLQQVADHSLVPDSEKEEFATTILIKVL